MATSFVSAGAAARKGDGSTEEKMALQAEWIDLVVECRKLIV
jgi:hypothetical protein